ncbi:type IV pilus twitching motility protein PilT [soil metagenome]
MTDLTTQDIETLCAAAEQYGASDLLLHEGRVPQLRLNGQLTAIEFPVLTASFFDSLWAACRAEADARDFDTSYTSASGTRFRVNLLRQLGLKAAVLRRIRRDIPDLANLGLPSELLQGWFGQKAGMVLICGPTGSGKSTTLAAGLEWMNGTMARHVVTIEDPIEYLFTSRSCLFTQREVGLDTSSFAEGLRRSLRQNPDVIFVGEIRDALTAMTAIQASETGHLVMATVHSSNCVDAVERLQLFFPTTERDSVRRTLSGQLLGILCQRLLPSTSGGVALASEYFSNIGAIRKYIAEGKPSELLDTMAKGDPRETRNFLSSLAQLVRAGQVSEEVAASAAENPQELQRALRGISSASQATRR